VTAPGNFERRLLIRQTWANIKYSYIKAVFVMGDSQNKTINDLILKESQKFNDIIQEDFHDNYENLTLKSVMVFKWSAQYCPMAKAFMKVDDDVHVQTKKLEKYLRSVLSQGMKNTFMCVVHRNAPVNRDPTNKWHVPYEQYRFDTLVTYCGGKYF
jgi:uncharacterized protein (DUF362 family)